MLKLAMVAVPPTDERLAAIAQLGVRHLVHYDMSNHPAKFDALSALVGRAARFGLDVPVVESGPPIDRIILGLDGAAGQIAAWLVLLPRLAENGVKVVCYNFMPQVLDDAMVVRTSEAARTRGGSLTTAFRRADLPAVIDGPPPLDVKMMRRCLEDFLAIVTPVADGLGIRLAMHPDDPPMSPIAGYSRIMSSEADFDWLVSTARARANGLTLCAGCLGEMRADLSGFARRHRDRIAFVHLRNMRGNPEDFMETWPDDGDLDLAGLLRAMIDSGVDAYVRPDHAPRLATEPPGLTGYGFQGHVFTLGYIRGLLDAMGHKETA